MEIPKIKQKSTSFKPEYQWAVDLADKQLDLFWVAKDYSMMDDAHSFRVELTKAERMMVIQTQRIFVHYEAKLGVDFWNGRFKQMFPRYEFERMGAIFGMMETGVHATFYTQMMDAMGLNTEEFHNEPFKDKELSKRLEFITESLRDGTDLEALAAMCFLEGTALFSSFGALLAFRKPNSFNGLKNMVSGLVRSCKDEILHCKASAMCFKQLLDESKLTIKEQEKLKASIKKMCSDIVEHELLILAKLFENGELRNITQKELSELVKERADKCLELLGLGKMFNITSEASKWFTPMVESYNFGDFFSSTQGEYNKSVNKELFTWK